MWKCKNCGSEKLRGHAIIDECECYLKVPDNEFGSKKCSDIEIKKAEIHCESWLCLNCDEVGLDITELAEWVNENV